MHNMKCLIAACTMAVVAAQGGTPTAPPPPTAAITVPGQDLAAGYEAEYLPVVQAIVDVIESQEPGFRPLLVRLAWHSCATFNPAALPVGGSTGGCARGAPEADLHDNKGIDKATGPLEKVKSKFPFVSYADLYQLAGNTAMEYMGTPPLYFRPGRTDFANKEMSTKCVNDDMRLPQKNINAEEAPHKETQEYFFEKFAELGFSLDTDPDALYKITALMGGHTFGTMHQEISRQEGNWTLANLEWGNDFYTNLMNGPWVASETRQMNDSIDLQYLGGPHPRFVMLPIDFQMRRDSRLSAICDEFKEDLPLFEKYFLIAWRQLQENGVVWPTDPPATTAPQGTTDAPAVVAPDTDTPSMQGSGFVASCASNNVNLGNIQMSYVVGQDAGQDQVQFTLTVNSGSSPQFAALGFADDATPDTMNGLNIVACSTSVIPQGFAEVSVSGAPTTQDNTETTPGTSTEAGGSLTCTFQRNIYDVDPVSSTKSLVFGAAFGIAFAMGTGEVGSTWVSHGAEPNRGRQSMTIDKCDTQAAPTTAPATNAPPTVAPSTTAPVTDAPATDAPTTVTPTSTPTSAPATDAPMTDAPATTAPATDAPATDAPDTEAPVTDAPMTGAPATTAPVTDAPPTDAPDTVTPTSTPTSAPATDAPPTAAPPTAHPGIDATNAPATGVPDTDAPDTTAPVTTAPMTDAPATAAPATDAPSTAAPSTTAPKTDAPLTQAPQTGAPATGAPDTTAPLTQAPATDAPATSAPPTAHPGIPATSTPTSAPSTMAPDTAVPTSAPVTDAPATSSPDTDAPTTTAPMTDAPATSAPPTAHPGIPATDAPATSVPTSAPSTAAPATDAPLTEAPATDASTTGTPTTTAPRTAYPGIVATDAPMTDAPATDAPATMSPRTAFPGIAATDAPATDAPATDAPTTTAPRTAYPGIPETTSPETETPPVREGGAASSDSDGSDTGAGFPYWALGIAGGVVAMCVAGAAVAHMKMQSGRLHVTEFFDNEMSMCLDDQQPVEPTSLRV